LRADVGDRIENDDPTRSDRDIRDWSAARRLGSPNLNAVSSFGQLIADIEQEAHDEGSKAGRELEQFREEFGRASAQLEILNGLPEGREVAGSFSQAQRVIADGDLADLAAVASRASRRRARAAVDRHDDR
jgi:hypothetical protein